MSQYKYENSKNYQEKILDYNGNETSEEMSQLLSNKYFQLEQDIFNLINFIRTNPLEYCNTLNYDQIELIKFLENIGDKGNLQPYKEIKELSDAARYLLNNIGTHYKRYNNLNMKEIDPTILNLRNRLSFYGERTGRIFETVLFKMDNPEDIVYHILVEEKGRNMLLNYKMKYIGIACDMLSNNLICTIIDIVQDFVPYRNKDIINNDISKIENISNNDNNFYSRISAENLKNKYLNYRKNSDYTSLVDELSYKNSKDNLKLNIIIPERKKKENSNNVKKDIIINENKEKNNKFINNYRNGHYSFYETPIKFPQIELEQNRNNILSPKSEILNDINVKKVHKRNNSNNINIMKKTFNNKKEDIDNNIMLGRSNIEQQEINDISTQKFINKSRSVCSYDINSNNSKKSNKNRFQRLNHEEKMEILHKINNRNSKSPNTTVQKEEIITNINPLTSTHNNYYQKNMINNKKSPMRNYMQEYSDIYSETEKFNLNKNNNKDSNINAPDNSIQTFTDLKSNEGFEKNEDYSKNKINQIKKELMHIRDQIKKELKAEVSEELRKEFNRKMIYTNKRIKPNFINLEEDYFIDNKPNKFDKFDNEKEIISTDDGNCHTNDRIYYNKRKINWIKNNGKYRWSSVQKRSYTNDNNMNNINNTNINKPDSNNNNNNAKENNNISLKEKYKENYEKLNYMPNNSLNNNDIGKTKDSNISRGTFHKDFLNMNNKRNNDNESESFANDVNKVKNKNEIKKLIRLYNMAKDNKRKSSVIYKNNNINIYDFIKNKKPSNDNYSQNNDVFNNEMMNEKKINDEINNNNKININNYYNIAGNYFGDNFDNINIPINFKTDFRKKYNIERNNSLQNNFLEGNKFQMKYQKVQPKGQIYQNKNPKQRNISVKKNIININDNNKPYNYTDRTEDIVNFEKSNIQNENNKSNNHKNKEIINSRNCLSSNNKSSISGRFIGDNNSKCNIIVTEGKKDDRNNKNKYRETTPFYAKSVKTEDKGIITNGKITTKEKKYNEQSDSIRQRGNNNTDFNYKNNNTKDIKSTNITKRYIKNNEKQANLLSLGRKTYDKTNYNKNNYVENDFLKTTFQYKKACNLNDNNSNNNPNKTPRYDNLTTKTYYKKKKYTPYSYYPYEHATTDKDNKSPKRLNYNHNKSLEKKYIKDPEGNLVETFVKKTKYNNGNGSVVLEYL